MSSKQITTSLSLIDLIFLGIGSIIGVGIFVVTGITAATTSGPAVIISFFVAGIASLFTALNYVELASCLGGSGGAYSYTNKAFSKSIGWIIGWVLLSEYAIGAGYLAMSWSGYLVSICSAIGIKIPYYLQHSIVEGGIINLPAIFIVVYMSFLLFIGTKTSARLNLVLVTIKLTTVFVFIIVASQYTKASNWNIFMPFGWSGVMHGAALVFNAFVGFDIIASAAEDAKNPKKNLPISMLITFSVSIILYVIVGGLLTAIAHYSTLNNAAAISNSLIKLHLNWVATAIGMGAIISIMTVLFGFLFGFTRIIYALSKDNLLPSFFTEIHPKNGTPYKTVIIAGIIILILIEIIPLNQAIKLINLGTLTAYTFVCFAVIKLRISHPEMNRGFKLPLNPLMPILGATSCIYLMFQLNLVTWSYFLGWVFIGILIYFYFHGRKKSQIVIEYKITNQ